MDDFSQIFDKNAENKAILRTFLNKKTAFRDK